jgi:hypothetical protein
MPELREASVLNLDPAQAAELARLVDLEARWENLRQGPRAPGAGPTTQDLQTKQKAYEAFHALLRAYNKRYRPLHVPEQLLNTPVRLALWCRAMRQLYLQVEDQPRGHVPTHLLEKAYRWADRVADRLTHEHVSRAALPETIRAAILALEALAEWCENLARTAPPAARSA